jgi:hypothetical protein
MKSGLYCDEGAARLGPHRADRSPRSTNSLEALMPRANPSASFAVAVRHLFRHLNDAAELERNPIVRRFFQSDAKAAALGGKSVIAFIRALVDAAANELRENADPADAPAIQRQIAIFYGCIERKNVKALASGLGISVRQCYRERFAMYCRIAHFIRGYGLQRAEPAAHIQDLNQVEMERARISAENGEYAAATRKYLSLLDDGDTIQKLCALLRLTELKLELGDLGAARSLLGDVMTSLRAQRDRLGESDVTAANAQIALLRARLAWEKGSFLEASRNLSRARWASRDFLQRRAARFREISADIALESAYRAFDVGDFDSTSAFLELVAAHNDSPTVSDARVAGTLILEATLHFATMRPGYASLLDTSALASKAQQIATRCGSLKWRLEAEITLTALERSTERVMRTASLVTAVLRDVGNPRLRSNLYLELADMMAETRFWPRGKALLRHTLPEESFCAGNFSLLKAVYDLKARSAAKALRNATSAYEVAKNARAPRLQASALRVLATAAYAMGSEKEAADYILAALPLAEKHGSAAACVKAYQSAALITGRQKYATQARTLAAAIRS